MKNTKKGVGRLGNVEKESKYSKNFLLKLYEEMVRIRTFETKAGEAFNKGELAGNIHLCIGQEATAVGANYALEERDFITSTHRGHGHCISKGAKTDKTMAELFGKETGYCGGKGGSMHIVDVQLGILGANGIVGAGIPIATGSGLTSKIRGTDEVTLCFFGDAGANTGAFHESINMAATWKLPVIYLIENNGLGVSVDIQSVINTPNLAIRSVAYDIPGKTVDGNDVLTVYEAVKEAVEYARAGNGPSIIECDTFRHEGHYCGDPSNYRPKEYIEEALEKDAIMRFKKYLLENEVTEEEIEAIDEAMEREIEDAYEFAVNSPYPSLDELMTDVYSQDNERCVVR